MPTTRGGGRQSGEDEESIDLQQQLVLLRQQVQEMRAQSHNESYASGVGSGRYRRHASSEHPRVRLGDSPQARGYGLYLCLQVRAWENIESIFRVLALISKP